MGAFFALLGAVVGYYLGYQWKPNTLIPSILFGLLFVCISFRKKKLWFYLVPLLMAFLIRLIPWAGKEGIKEVEGIVVYARNNYFIIQSGWARYYVYEKGSLREVGDYLHCYGLSQEFLNTTYEGHFDFGQYLYQKGVLYTFRARSIDAPFQMPVRFREMERKFLSFFSSGTQGLLDAILFNHKDLNNESVALASSLGLLGVLSSSGLLYGSALRIIRKLLSLKLSEKVASVLVLAVAAFLLPFAMGACMAVDGNVATDAFGLVAMVAMTPLISIQLLGYIYERVAVKNGTTAERKSRVQVKAASPVGAELSDEEKYAVIEL